MVDKAVSGVFVITIDGPSGTGKGTVALKLAKELGWHFLDSGAIYRALALAARQEEIKPDNIDALVALAHRLHLHFEITSQDESLTCLNGKDVSTLIRSEQCGQDASKIAAIPAVREALLARQRGFAVQPGLVTDGRDMGTVVFPGAYLKIYLDASCEERANRRYLQLKDKKNDVSLAQVVEELAKRDARDMARAHSPLKPADDAVIIDTTNLSVAQVLDHVLHLVQMRLPA